jgi:hypothetical protein
MARVLYIQITMALEKIKVQWFFGNQGTMEVTLIGNIGYIRKCIFQ